MREKEYRDVQIKTDAEKRCFTTAVSLLFPASVFRSSVSYVKSSCSAAITTRGIKKRLQEDYVYCIQILLLQFFSDLQEEKRGEKILHEANTIYLKKLEQFTLSGRRSQTTLKRFCPLLTTKYTLTSFVTKFFYCYREKSAYH